MLKTVLIAEDQPDIRSMTKYMVESFGYNVIEARDGFEALEQAKRSSPDLILMDIAMPEMNGVTSATLIRKSGKCDKTPIVAFTSYGKEYISMANEFGFDQVVQKPMEPEELQLLLKEYLNGNS